MSARCAEVLVLQAGAACDYEPPTQSRTRKRPRSLDRRAEWHAETAADIAVTRQADRAEDLPHRSSPVASTSGTHRIGMSAS